MSNTIDYKTFILKYFPFVNKIRFWAQPRLKILFMFLRKLPGSSIHFGPPRGYYSSIENIQDQFLAKKVELDLGKVISRKLPITQSNIINQSLKSLLHPKTLQKTAYIFQDARYYGDVEGVIITKDDKIFVPCSPLKNEWFPEKHQSLFKLMLPKTQYLEKIVVVDSRCADNNYGHWMLDHLTRFYWLKKLNLNFEDYVLVSRGGDQGFQKFSYETMKAHGFKFKDYINGQGKHIAAKEVVVPPYSTEGLSWDRDTREFREMEFLRSLFLSSRPSLPLHRIYISRRKSIRTFEGEIELVSCLKDYNFKEVFLEELTISEQASLFANAEVILGLHGSGLANLCFSSPFTKVVEIFSPNYIRTDFWSVADLMGCNYYAYCDDQFLEQTMSFRVSRNSPTKFNLNNLLDYLLKQNII